MQYIEGKAKQEVQDSKKDVQRNKARKEVHGSKGGGMGIAFFAMAVVFLALLVLLNVADYMLYSAKRNLIARAVDYSVCSAVQEIDVARSREGLSTEYDEISGIPSVTSIFLNEENADNAFFSTFQFNTGIEETSIKPYVIRVIVNPLEDALECHFKKGSLMAQQLVYDEEQLEDAINSRIREWQDESSVDSHVIYVNGNPYTRKFQKRPYYMVIIKDYEIDGLFKRRNATFVGFAGARIERRQG